MQLNTIIRILDMQQEFQKDPTSVLGFKNYSEIKDLYSKLIEAEKLNSKKKKMADAIVAGDTTTVAPSRMDHSADDDLDRQTTTFDRVPTDLQKYTEQG